MEQTQIEDINLCHHENKRTMTLKALTGSKRQVKNETIYKSVLLNLSDSDSSKTNPNKYGTKGFDVEAISPIFCDNIMLAAALPKEKISQLGTNSPQIGGDITKI